MFAQVGEFGYYRDQLWTAPELLRMTTRPISGTQKADVYSFAIILQEIMFRAEPYFINLDPPECVYTLQLQILTYHDKSRILLSHTFPVFQISQGIVLVY